VRKALIIQLLGLAVVIGVLSFIVAWFVPWLPDPASEQAERIRDTYWLTSIICLVIIAIVASVSLYAIVKFRARPDDEEDGKPTHGHTGLEIFWTAIPTVLVTIIAVYSGVVLVKNEDTPPGHRIVEVKAWQFAWNFNYPDQGLESVGELHLPIGETTELQLNSEDVIHSFWVKEWGVKQDVVPGTVQRYVITPTKLGRFEIICTELCGIGHSTMRNWVVVETREDYDRWLSEQQEQAPQGEGDGAPAGEEDDVLDGDEADGDEEGAAGEDGVDAPVALGQQVFAEAGCGSCHTFADAGSTGQVGPDLDTVLPGQDADAIRQSIVEPDAEITEGFPPGVMPQNYGELLSGEQLDGLVTYLVETAGEAP
jgi:cytochrome c oxidase subunit 2